MAATSKLACRYVYRAYTYILRPTDGPSCYREKKTGNFSWARLHPGDCELIKENRAALIILSLLTLYFWNTVFFSFAGYLHPRLCLTPGETTLLQVARFAKTATYILVLLQGFLATYVSKSWIKTLTRILHRPSSADWSWLYYPHQVRVLSCSNNNNPEY